MNPNFKFITIDPEKLEFHSSCSEGLDEFLLEEIKNSSLQILSFNRGGVFYCGKRADIYKFLLSTRFSSRISFTLHKFVANNSDELYDKAYSIPWERIIMDDAAYKIESMAKDSMENSRFAMYRLKDSIQDRIRNKEKREALIDREYPDIEIILRSNRENVSIAIGITAKPLNKRGYRLDTVSAPIRENLAQALIHFSGWDRKSIFIDPMCGSGTIIIEAALLLKNKGQINQKLLFDSIIFKEMFKEEVQKFNSSLQESGLDSKKSKTNIIYGYDIDPDAIKKAKKNIERAGVSDFIQLEVKDVLQFSNIYNDSKGCIVTNPPYGERMGYADELKEFYFEIGKILKDNFSGFRFTLICGDKSLLGHFRLKADKEKSITISKLKGKFVSYLIQ